MNGRITRCGGCSSACFSSVSEKISRKKLFFLCFLFVSKVLRSLRSDDEKPQPCMSLYTTSSIGVPAGEQGSTCYVAQHRQQQQQQRQSKVAPVCCTPRHTSPLSQLAFAPQLALDTRREEEEERRQFGRALTFSQRTSYLPKGTAGSRTKRVHRTELNNIC